MTETITFEEARKRRIILMLQNYILIQKPKFSLYQKLFKLSEDEKEAYKLYKQYMKKMRKEK